MCCEDITIGNESTSRQTLIRVVANTPTQLVAKSKSRIGLWIIPNAIDAICVSMLRPVDATDGIQMFAGIQPLRMNLRDDGDACQQTWWAFNAGGSTMYVIEIFAGPTCDG